MSPRIRSIAIIVGTLVAGMVLGGVIVGAIAQKRVDGMRDVRRPGGFVRRMEELIVPRDEAQRRAIRPLLERTDRRNRSIVDAARRDMRMAFDSMTAELAPLLSAGQMERLREDMRRRDAERRPPPGLPGGEPPHPFDHPPGGPPPGGPPPDGRPPGPLPGFPPP